VYYLHVLHCLDYNYSSGSDSVTIAIWPVSPYLIVLNILNQTMACTTSIHSNQDSLWLKYALAFLTFSQALLMSTLSSEFSKAANLFEILT
jgi:hypothetical protein